MHELFQGSADGDPNSRAFWKRIRVLSPDSVFGSIWHEMFIGIEVDGYRHS